MSNMNLLKKEPAYDKLFRLFKEKYESLGRVGGAVSLKRFTARELEVISGLTGIPFEELAEKQSLTLLRFEKELRKTQYDGYSLTELLEDFFGERLIIKKDRLAAEKDQEKAFLQSCFQLYPRLEWYVTWLSEKSPDTRWIWVLYRENAEVLSSQLALLERAFERLKDKNLLIRLPLFAQQVTGNPHGLDRHETMGKLFLHALTVEQRLKGEEVGFNRSAEEENDLLGLYGLLRDDLWSFVTFQNLIAETRDGIVHPVWQAACEAGSVLNLPFKEMVKIEKVRAYSCNHVYVIENSSVASTVMDLQPKASIICTHGQLRLASWKLLDKLNESNMTIHYSGDLDPEGLLIADRIKQKFNNATLWHMDTPTYQKHQSNETITKNSLEKLKNIKSAPLQKLAELIKTNQKAAYQEAYVEELVEDI